MMHFPLQINISYYSAICFLLIPLFVSSAFNISATLKFQESYSPLFSTFNIKPSPDHYSVSLLLNRFSGTYAFVIASLLHCALLLISLAYCRIIHAFRLGHYIIRLLQLWLLQRQNQDAIPTRCWRCRCLLCKHYIHTYIHSLLRIGYVCVD